MNAEPAKSTQDAPLTSRLNQSHGSFELVLSPIILGLLGFWADRTWSTGPWLTIVAATFGLAGAVVKLYYGYQTTMAAHASQAPWRRETRSAEDSGVTA